ncbi:MAG: UDP-3-O-[3-hydroxymyristoyl] N-acetylglucosamine deacetylase [Planctomycetaceae bacterium]|nr:UDP-3-O-[3-hydroxymyristoyl] N-acetylglucosamine deacetylase [Planctomycetaceae bacterium]
MRDERTRRQRTLSRSVALDGHGLFCGQDVRLELCPAPEDHGIVFERIDLPTPIRIPALIDFVVPQPRCTVIQQGGAHVAVIEHVMAALAGMQVDNCLVRLNAPEPPGCDGSAIAFVELIDEAGVVEQTAEREVFSVPEAVTVVESHDVGVAAMPPRTDEYEIGFLLDYGNGPIHPQGHCCQLSPEEFRSHIAAARTFVLRKEVEALRAQGIGLRATPQDLLVFDTHGPIDNSLRFRDECARHKLLDCVGDFALFGCDLRGRFVAQQSGHRLNHALVRELRKLREQAGAAEGHSPSQKLRRVG